MKKIKIFNNGKNCYVQIPVTENSLVDSIIIRSIVDLFPIRKLTAIIQGKNCQRVVSDLNIEYQTVNKKSIKINVSSSDLISILNKVNFNINSIEVIEYKDDDNILFSLFLYENDGATLICDKEYFIKNSLEAKINNILNINF